MSEDHAWSEEPWSRWNEDDQPVGDLAQAMIPRVRRIELQIGRLVAHMESERRTRREQTNEIRTDIKALKEALSSSAGDGGMYARIIMLESRWASWQRWLWLLGGGMVALFFNLAKEFISK